MDYPQMTCAICGKETRIKITPPEKEKHTPVCKDHIDYVIAQITINRGDGQVVQPLREVPVQ